jgi:hypothetical protein
MSYAELKQLFAWCDFAQTNEEFWRRFVVACLAYGPRMRLPAAYLALLAGYDEVIVCPCAPPAIGDPATR